MRIRVDKENDALYFRLDESRIMESEEIKPGIILNSDENNQVGGIGLLGISSRASKIEVSSIQFQTA